MFMISGLPRLAVHVVIAAALYAGIEWLSIHHPEPVALLCLRFCFAALCLLAVASYAVHLMCCTLVGLMDAVDRKTSELEPADLKDDLPIGGSRERALEDVVKSLSAAGYQVSVESAAGSDSGLECQPAAEDLTAALQIGDQRKLQ